MLRRAVGFIPCPWFMLLLIRLLNDIMLDTAKPNPKESFKVNYPVTLLFHVAHKKIRIIGIVGKTLSVCRLSVFFYSSPTDNLTERAILFYVLRTKEFAVSAVHQLGSLDTAE